MNHLNEIDDNINELILNKSFDKLTEAEKIKALEYAGSEEEYNKLRQTLMAITSSFSDEAEEEFAGDEMKSDLMSQFEKKYGNSGQRTKVVPLYRKTYFQLAVAASLTLLVFISIPIFRQSGKDGNAELAKVEMAGKPDNTTEETITGTSNNQITTTGQTKPDAGTAEIKEKDASVVTETRADGALATNDQQKDKLMASEKGETKVTESPLTTVRDESVADKEVAYKSLSGPDGTNRESLLKQRVNDNTSANDNNEGDVVLLEKGKKNEKKKEEADKKITAAPPAETEKSAFEYSNHKSDHTHDHLDRLNTMATSGTAVSSKNMGSTGVTHFVEQNKTQMMDLLFTVY